MGVIRPRAVRKVGQLGLEGAMVYLASKPGAWNVLSGSQSCRHMAIGFSLTDPSR